MNIAYPYLPEGRNIKHVSAENPFMKAAFEYARDFSLDSDTATASVIVKDGEIIGRGANGSEYHKTHECVRVLKKIPTGQGYELCEGCHPKNHSEPRAIADVAKNGYDTHGADLYLWGHWWFCKPCWDTIIEAGIQDVYLLQDSEKLFRDGTPESILGKQFK